MIQVFKTHINLEKKINMIRDSLLENYLETNNIEYSEGYKDKNGTDKFLESFKIIENNITFNVLLVIDDKNCNNIFMNVFNNKEINKKYEIINKYVIQKLKEKYKSNLEILKNNNEYLIIGIKIYIVNNNKLKIILKIEKED